MSQKMQMLVSRRSTYGAENPYSIAPVCINSTGGTGTEISHFCLSLPHGSAQLSQDGRLGGRQSRAFTLNFLQFRHRISELESKHSNVGLYRQDQVSDLHSANQSPLLYLPLDCTFTISAVHAILARLIPPFSYRILSISQKDKWTQEQTMLPPG